MNEGQRGKDITEPQTRSPHQTEGVLRKRAQENTETPQ